MRVVIVGGRTRADYLMGALAEEAEAVVVINDDRRFCEYLSSRHEGTVIWGDGTKRSVLEDADVAGFDAIVALTGYDADNLAICQVAKAFLDIRLQLCIVSNPENTRIFRQLGVTAAISATAALTQAIRDAIGAVAPGEGEAAAEDADQREPGDEGNIDPDEDGGEEGGSLLSLLGSWHRIGKDRR
ncbi:MAG: TrkA family potassium uptake protein [Enterorhabdus sp.]|nr:TrkA family potassium uptake protein [Enterorhabdus sp.]